MKRLYPKDEYGNTIIKIQCEYLKESTRHGISLFFPGSKKTFFFCPNELFSNKDGVIHVIIKQDYDWILNGNKLISSSDLRGIMTTHLKNTKVIDLNIVEEPLLSTKVNTKKVKKKASTSSLSKDILSSIVKGHKVNLENGIISLSTRSVLTETEKAIYFRTTNIKFWVPKRYTNPDKDRIALNAPLRFLFKIFIGNNKNGDQYIELNQDELYLFFQKMEAYNKEI